MDPKLREMVEGHPVEKSFKENKNLFEVFYGIKIIHLFLIILPIFQNR